VTGPLRFPRSARLLAKADFDAAFGRGTRLGGAFFRLHVLGVPDAPARLGCAIAKRNIPRACDRNRLRRHVREAFRHARERLAGRALVFSARTEARDADAAALRADLSRLIDRAAALNPTGPTGTMPG
jgi:ribonuclease P protein component